MDGSVGPQRDADRIEILIELIDEMIGIITEENAALAIGIPASRAQQLARKIELAALLDNWKTEVAAKRLDFAGANAPLRDKLIDRVKLLDAIMHENVGMLVAAIETSKRRIDAVMAAVRENISEVSPYSARGRVVTPTSSCVANLRV